jgi:hypothetical protein
MLGRLFKPEYVTNFGERCAVHIPRKVWEQFIALPLVDDGIGVRRRKLDHNGIILDYVEIYCNDCDRTDMSVFNVHNQLWAKYGVGKARLCLDCFQIRLGRKVTTDDLTDAPCNWDLIQHLSEKML